jgi:hypothetical protein
VYENRVLRRIFGHFKEGVVGDWRRLHNEELHDLDALTNIIRAMKLRMRWAGHVAYMGEMRKVYETLVGKPEGKRPLQRPRHRQEVNIRMTVREIWWEGVDWIHLAQNRNQWWALVNTVMNLQFP